MKVQNMTSSNGNAVPNQFLITGVGAGTFAANVNGGRIASGDLFQSYETNVAYRDFMGQIYLDRDYWLNGSSRTTAKYRNQFTGLSTKQTCEGVETGSIILTDLN